MLLWPISLLNQRRLASMRRLLILHQSLMKTRELLSKMRAHPSAADHVARRLRVPDSSNECISAFSDRYMTVYASRNTVQHSGHDPVRFQ